MDHLVAALRLDSPWAGSAARVLAILVALAVCAVAPGGLPGPVRGASPITLSADAPSFEVPETSVRATGTYDDPDGRQVALSADVGYVAQAGTSAGTWMWYGTMDGPSSTTVTVTAEDGVNPPVQVSFDVIVDNVPPGAGTKGPAYVPVASKVARRFIWSASDVLGDPVTTEVDCGSGIETGAGDTHMEGGKYIDCVFPTAGSTLVGVRASDDDGASTDGRMSVLATTQVQSLADGMLFASGANLNDAMGGAVAVADLNGDGRGDVIVGRQQEQGNPSTGPGYVAVLLGGRGPESPNLGTLTADEGFYIRAAESGDGLGWSVAAAGDVNGDGLQDAIIGSTGAAYVIFGSRTISDVDLANLPADRGFTITGVGGRVVAGVGDLNGDGLADVAVPGPPGAVYVIYGRRSFPAAVDATALSGAEGFAVRGPAGVAGLGESIAAGDVNGDGRIDLVFGDTHAYTDGSVFVVYGRAQATNVDLTTIDPSVGFRLDGTTAASSFGSAVAVADLDVDGYADLIVGDPWGRHRMA